MSSNAAQSRPHPRLTGLVESYEGSVLSGFPAGVHVGSPGLSVPLILTLRDHPVLLADPDPSDNPRSYTSLVAGLHARPVLIHHDGSAATLTINLTPGGVRHLFGVPARSLAGTSTPAPAVVGSSVEALRQRLELVHSWAAAFALVDDYLLSRLPDPLPEGRLVDVAWRMIRSGHGRVKISTIAQQLGCSPRTLHAQVHRETGLGPKTLSRIARFTAARQVVHLRLMRGHRAPALAQIAAECGYYDEAHLLREWCDFTGTTPTRWRAHDETAFHQSYRAPEFPSA